MRRRCPLLFPLALVLAAGPVLLAAPPPRPAGKTAPARPAPAGPLAAADAAFARQSYAVALRAYREALRRGVVTRARLGEVEYRVADCLGRAQQWQEALAAGRELARRHAGTVWEPRAHALLMKLYLEAPHGGWRVGRRTYRGEAAPESTAAEPAVPVDLTADDLAASLREAELGLRQLEKLRPTLPDGRDEADLAADLAELLDQQFREPPEGGWPPPADPVWKPDPAGSYDPAWPAPRRILQLYLRAERVGTAAQKPLARLAQANWLRSYHQRMRQVPEGETTWKPYPYEERGAIATLTGFLAAYPRHPQAHRAALLAADWLEEDGKYAEAAAVHEAFLKEHPDSEWAAESERVLTELRSPRLRLHAGGPQPPGRRAVLRAETRNLRAIRFTARRLRLPDALRDPKMLLNREQSLSGLLAALGSGIERYLEGDPVSWQAPLQPGSRHAPLAAELEAPLTRNGAYLVRAVAGKLRAAAVLVISDLAAVQVAGSEETVVLSVNAATGAPVGGVRVLTWAAPMGHEKRILARAEQTTGPDGLAVIDTRTGRESMSNDVALAWKGDRYALTSSAFVYYEPAEKRRAYVYTERPVYRPGQPVHVRVLLAERGEDGGWKPAPGARLKLALQGPPGAPSLTRDLTTGEFGTAHDRLDLGSGIPTGEYRVTVSWRERRWNEPGAWFRVEEYRRPEFEVTVAPDGETPRVGEPHVARVTARYYFGGPAARARVRYRITREGFRPLPPFASDYPSLYAAALPPLAGEGPGEEVLPPSQTWTGATVTDARGQARIPLDTVVPEPYSRDCPLRFTVTAEVMDTGRRTVEGTGEIVVPARDFEAHLRPERGFFEPGETVRAEVRTLRPDGSGVPARGQVVVSRVTPVPARDDDEEEKLAFEEVYRAPLATGADGGGVFEWQPGGAGRYQLRFEAPDGPGAPWARPVTAGAEVWVAGDAAGSGVSPREQVRLVTAEREYEVGGTVRALLAAEKPGATALLVLAQGNRLLGRRLVRLEGRSGVVELPLAMRHAPEVTLHVYGVQNRRQFQDEVRLRVVPAERLLTVEVRADRERYRPGERARLRLRARDAAGRPARAELGLGVVDASLYALQPELAEPLAGYFYGSRMEIMLIATHSLDSGFEETHAGGPEEFERSPWKMPPGLGRGILYLSEFDVGRILHGYPRDNSLIADTGGMGAGMMGGAGAPGMPSMVPEAELDRARKAPPVPVPALRVRQEFQDTAFWAPSVVTDARGEATVEFPWPDNLTRWRATARGWSPYGAVGEATAEVETRKDLLVRLQAPRFLVERDEATLSANVHNFTESPQRVRVALRADGLEPVQSAPEGPRPARVPRADRVPQTPPRESASAAPDSSQWVEVPAGGERRVDWRVRAARAGEARLRVTAEGDVEGDGVERTLPVYVHGAERLLTRAGTLARPAGARGGPARVKLSLELPAERAPGSGELVVRLSPTTAAAMLDALPYLVDYPYGCTEQTLSRFLPAVVVKKTLLDLGTDLPALRRRALEEARARRAAAPADRPAARKRAPGPYSYADPAAARPAGSDPVFSPEVLERVVRAGLERLQRFQDPRGGWGWWNGDTTDVRLTAYVVQGLLTARAAGVRVPPGMLARGLAALEKAVTAAKEPHVLLFGAWALAHDPPRSRAASNLALAKVYSRREKLSAYSLALLAQLLQRGGRAAEARICLENLENTAEIDRAAGTCSWPSERGAGWDWEHEEVETAAACLTALDAARHPLAPLAARWLVQQRHGTAWQSTRATALAVQALAGHARRSGELSPDCTVTVEAPGGVRRRFRITPENVLTGDFRVVVPAASLTAGPQPVTLTLEGTGAVHYVASLRAFTLEEGIRAAGEELRVRRRYFRLERPAAGSGSRAGLTPDGYTRTAIGPDTRLHSGDLVEVELLLDSKNAYDYLVFEDIKPAGCEPVELRSGFRYAGGLCSNMELRDAKVAFFITHLPAGRRLITYRVRAEAPGLFHALPLHGYAMYAPEVRCLSAESLIGIRNREDEGEQ